ncbi:MAG: hypothetical protein U0T81_02075 [Saprospiraceae bacterium]
MNSSSGEVSSILFQPLKRMNARVIRVVIQITHDNKCRVWINGTD